MVVSNATLVQVWETSALSDRNQEMMLDYIGGIFPPLCGCYLCKVIAQQWRVWTGSLQSITCWVISCSWILLKRFFTGNPCMNHLKGESPPHGCVTTILFKTSIFFFFLCVTGQTSGSFFVIPARQFHSCCILTILINLHRTCLMRHIWQNPEHLH